MTFHIHPYYRVTVSDKKGNHKSIYIKDLSEADFEKYLSELVAETRKQYEKEKVR